MPDKLLNAYTAATEVVISGAQKSIESKWRTAFFAGFEQEMLDLFLQAALPQVEAVQRLVAGLAANFLSQRTGKRVMEIGDQAITPPEDVRQSFINQFITGRKLIKDGGTRQDAIDQTVANVMSYVATEAQTAKIKQSQDSLITADASRYKRVTDPDPCALCLVASTKVYYVEELLPIHDWCQCDVDTIQPGDITVVNGKEYVGLDKLTIPEDMMTIGPRANPNSMRSRLKGYLQDLDKRQFESGVKAWEETIQVSADKQSPRLSYKSDKAR